MANAFKVLIIGAGIVGLATALQLLKKNPQLSVAILDKENEVGFHQTGHNSGVIHSGIYYKPGSLKAKNCIDGANQLTAFCNENHIPYRTCGKVIAALTREEIPRLEELMARGKANRVPGLRMIGPEELKEIEPHAFCLRALYSPATAIIDYKLVATAYAENIKKLGGEIFLQQEVRSITQYRQEIIIGTKKNEFQAAYLINCSGLHADRIARMADTNSTSWQIIPFRGEYYDLIPASRHLVKGLIYPVPDPRFPFLGVHLTRMINGGVEAGPNAVLALSREGYKKSAISLRDCTRLCGYAGMWRMALRYWRMGAYEVYRSFVKRAFLKDVQRLMPCIQHEDLIPGNAGVRAQMVAPDGKLVDDFLIEQRGRMIHVLNAPSPAATASLSIGQTIADRARVHFNLSIRSI